MLGPEVPSISFLLGLGLSEPWAARGPFNSRLWELKLMFLASTMSLGVAYGTGSFVTRILGHWQMSFTSGLCFYLFSIETSEADKKSRSLKEFLERLDFVISTKDRLQQGFEPLFGPFHFSDEGTALEPSLGT